MAFKKEDAECFRCGHFRELQKGEERLSFVSEIPFGVCMIASKSPMFKSRGIPWFCYLVPENELEICKSFISKVVDVEKMELITDDF